MRAAIFSTKARQRNRDYLAWVKTDVPCLDCKVVYPPYVMQFDHIADDKDRAVAALAQAGASLDRLKAEIAKCELVCANCHALRTHQRRSGGGI